MRLNNLLGRRFGRLVVIDRIKGKDGKAGKWVCACDCGGQKSTLTEALTTGYCRSCGCLAREMTAARSRKPDTYFRAVMKTYVRNAANRGIPFELSPEEFREIIKRPCFFCGVEASRKYSTATTSNQSDSFPHNGVDRFDNSKGYTVENSVPCCTQCNRMKHAMSASEFMSHITRVYAFSIIP